jgi:hypothetical protein
VGGARVLDVVEITLGRIGGPENDHSDTDSFSLLVPWVVLITSDFLLVASIDNDIQSS